MELIFMIRPCPASRMKGSTAAHIRTAPVKFVFIWRCISSSVVSSIAPLIPIPALLTSTSMLPCSFRIVDMALDTDAGSVISNCNIVKPGLSDTAFRLEP